MIFKDYPDLPYLSIQDRRFQVYNDSKQIFIKLPESAAKTEVPVLLAMKGKREQLVNYRVQNNTFIVDGLFEHLTLISGVGRQQERVDVKRSVK